MRELHLLVKIRISKLTTEWYGNRSYRQNIQQQRELDCQEKSSEFMISKKRGIFTKHTKSIKIRSLYMCYHSEQCAFTHPKPVLQNELIIRSLTSIIDLIFLAVAEYILHQFWRYLHLLFFFKNGPWGCGCIDLGSGISISGLYSLLGSIPGGKSDNGESKPNTANK